MRIIWGIIIVIVGALLVVYGDKVYDAFGPIPFAEKYLGTEGGSRLFYKLLGVVACVLGFMIMTGTLGPLFLSIFGSIFPGVRTQ